RGAVGGRGAAGGCSGGGPAQVAGPWLRGPGPRAEPAVLRFQAVEKGYGTQPVLQGVSFDVPSGAAVGLVGANGAGKTTLLRIAAGEEPPDAGRVILDAGDRVAYLPQDAGVQGERALFDELLSAFAELEAVRHELARVEVGVVAA